jgi:hypothetical protein
MTLNEINIQQYRVWSRVGGLEWYRAHYCAAHYAFFRAIDRTREAAK